MDSARTEIKKTTTKNSAVRWTTSEGLTSVRVFSVTRGPSFHREIGTEHRVRLKGTATHRTARVSSFSLATLPFQRLYVYMYSLLHSTPTPFSASPLTSPRVCLSLIELESFRLVVRYRAHFSALPFNPHCCLLSHDPRASFSCLSAFSCGISSLFSLLFLPHR